MKKIKIPAALLTAALLCGCSENAPAPETEIPVTAETTTEDMSYVLVRPWLGSEMLGSIFYCGGKRPLPIAADENAGLENLPDTLYFENGSAKAKYDGAGNIVGLRFERDSAPSDFSIYGIDFTSRPEDIPQKAGIADSVYGDKNGTVTYSFYGGGITELTFVYTDKNLVSVYIEA